MDVHASDLLTIADVAKRSGVAASALRFYEQRGLIAQVFHLRFQLSRAQLTLGAGLRPCALTGAQHQRETRRHAPARTYRQLSCTLLHFDENAFIRRGARAVN